MFVPAIPVPQVAPEHVEDNGTENTAAGASAVEGKNSDGQPTTSESEPILEREH